MSMGLKFSTMTGGGLAGGYAGHTQDKDGEYLAAGAGAAGGLLAGGLAIKGAGAVNKGVRGIAGKMKKKKV